jgi:N-methylhydantoinase A
MLMSDVRRDYALTRPGRVDESAASHIGATFERMENTAMESFLDEGFQASDLRFERLADMRYEGQEHTVGVPLPNGAIAGTTITEILHRFHESYEREYTYRLTNAVEIVTFRVVAFGKIEQPQLAKLQSSGASAEAAQKGTRTVDMDGDGVLPSTVYDRARLRPGMTFKGPAIIEEPGGTTVVFPRQVVSVDVYGNLHIQMEDAE